jgi:PAS domain S-box-containing protein
MKTNILIVDDEKSIRFTFENFLAEEGYEVATAKDYDEALERMAGTEIDLIFADILLGGRTGIDLLQEVKRRELGCPVVMITGAPNIGTASEAVRLGAFDYLPKPVEKETLLHVAHLALKHKSVMDENKKYRSNLETIFRSVKDAIIMVDTDMNVIEVNDAAKNICGFTREGVIGERYHSLTGACNGQCTEIFEKTIKSKQTVEAYHLECQHRDRSTQIVNVTTSPLVSSQNKISGAVMVIRDDTRLAVLERGLGERRQFHNMVGQNEKLQHIYALIEDLADVQTTVLITGESGTGKELVAEALHYKGVRSQKPLVKVNCSALPETLLESELFGHVKGAFTGAVRDKVGRFQRAHGGTIFLDEIGEVSPRMQLRLLRVLQEMEFERVGDSTPIKVDVRVVAATNQDIYEKVRRGEFREDLYYRLKVVEISLPPLRDRRDDIPLLLNHFMQKFNQKFNKKIVALTEEVQKAFMDHTWPGNVRELEHTLEHAFIVCHQDTITMDHLPSNYLKPLQKKTSPLPGTGRKSPQAILEALERTAWNKSRAARLLGIGRMTLYRKIEEYKLTEQNKNQ